MVALDNIVNGSAKNASPSTNGTSTTNTSLLVLNLDQGDPTMYELYWKRNGDACVMEIRDCDLMSYFSDTGNVCWFLEPKLTDAIKRLHCTVGNASVDDRYILVGTGSSQLFQAALYALCSSSVGPHPVPVVCAAPYYSCYQEQTDFLKSGIHKWGGDAYKFDKEGQYIEVVTSPNNPDGCIREAVVKRSGGQVIHDLAYYWPQYTPITHPADHDIMLFTLSKATGHAGSRIGWALVKDKDVAKKMVEYMQISTIGVSKEAQIRAAKILAFITETSQENCTTPGYPENFFEFSRHRLGERWEKLRAVVKNSKVFSLTEYPQGSCNSTGNYTGTNPSFAWLKCKDSDTGCAKLLKAENILARSGDKFGVSSQYARISMVSRDDVFNLFLERLSSIEGVINN